MGAIYGAHSPLQSIFTLYRMGILVNRARARKSGQDEPLPPEPGEHLPTTFLEPLAGIEPARSGFPAACSTD